MTAKEIEHGTTHGQRLKDLSRTGDLSDCFKVYFGVGSPPSHRLTYRQLDGEATGTLIEVVEIVAVEQREADYVYLLTASRLGRLPNETRKAFNTVHQQVIKARNRRR